MPEHFTHLGPFSEWVSVACSQRNLYPSAPPGAPTQTRIRELLGFCDQDECPHDVQIEGSWEHEGVVGEAVSWSVGYGPRTAAWVLKPAGLSEPLPGVVALHDHGGFKFFGKEKIADGPGEVSATVQAFREICYGGRAFANALAREGFVVLVHDTFLWGSRRFPLEVMPGLDRQIAANFAQWWFEAATAAPEIAHYNAAAYLHETVIEKYCALLGTTLAGVVSYEDRVAVTYLRSRPDVVPERLGCIGLSGGGNRAALLQATCDHLGATAVVGLMSSYRELLDHNVASHTWMLFPHGLARYADWPDLAACRAPAPLLVQYDLDDELFTEVGMRAAHERIAAHYCSVGAPSAYTGQFYPGPHKFDLDMQMAAFTWLHQQLGDDISS